MDWTPLKLQVNYIIYFICFGMVGGVVVGSGSGRSPARPL